MALYLARDDGTGAFLPDLGFGHLLEIAHLDAGLGQTDHPTDVKGIQVAYAQTLSGIPPDRLDDLVNENGYAAPPDVVIFPVGGAFVLADGTMITSAAGVATPVGDALNPTAADVATIYDTSQCNGAGYWIDREGGGTTGDPSSVILYHELSHCWHFVTGTTAATSAAEEEAAEHDENDMRDRRGIAHREPTSHDGGCGGGPSGCCIVATVASGSPYSEDVNRLRVVRDQLLRRGRLGEDFFERLHYDYYSFSPEVVRLMGRSRSTHQFVRDSFVFPLLAGLELISACVTSKGDLEAIADVLDCESERVLAVTEFNLPDAATRGELARIAEIALSSPYVRWALLDVMALWMNVAPRLAQSPKSTIGSVARDAVCSWAGRLPLSPLWDELTPSQVVACLRELDDLLWDYHSRSAFAKRLCARLPAATLPINDWVQQASLASSAQGDIHG